MFIFSNFYFLSYYKMANLQNKVLLDPRIAIGGNPVQTTTIGCEQVLNRRIPATNQSTTQVQWQSLINPSQALTGRVLVIEYTVTIVAPTTANPPGEGDVVFPIVNGIANSGANPLLPTAVLRSNPLARVCNNLTVGINSQSTSINPQYVHGVMGFALLTPAERKKFASMFPSMLPGTLQHFSQIVLHHQINPFLVIVIVMEQLVQVLCRLHPLLLLVLLIILMFLLFMNQ